MPFTGDQLVLGTKSAISDLSARTNQYLLVKSTASGDFSPQVTAGGPCIGILQDRPISGEPGQIAVAGVSKLRINSTAHDAIAVGDKLSASTAAGGIISTAVAVFTVARALETLSSNSPATAQITVLLTFEGAGSSADAGGA